MPKTTILGKVSLTPQGDFVLGTAYHVLDVVYSPADYAAFVALQDNENVGLEDTTVWMKLVQGMEGKSAYTAAAEAGYAGTEEAFYTELAGIAASAAAAGASAEQAATAATAAKADADRAQTVADQVTGLPGRMDALEGSVGTKPQGAADTAWENIGVKPEGASGSLWENLGTQGGVPVKPAVTDFVFDISGDTSYITVTQKSNRLFKTGNIVTITGNLTFDYHPRSTESSVLLKFDLPSSVHPGVSIAGQHIKYYTNGPNGRTVLYYYNCSIYNHILGIPITVVPHDQALSNARVDYNLTYQLEDDFGASVLEPDLSPLKNALITGGDLSQITTPLQSQMTGLQTLLGEKPADFPPEAGSTLWSALDYALSRVNTGPVWVAQTVAGLVSADLPNSGCSSSSSSFSITYSPVLKLCILDTSFTFTGKELAPAIASFSFSMKGVLPDSLRPVSQVPLTFVHSVANLSVSGSISTTGEIFIHFGTKTNGATYTAQISAPIFALQ